MSLPETPTIPAGRNSADYRMRPFAHPLGPDPTATERMVDLFWLNSLPIFNLLRDHCINKSRSVGRLGGREVPEAGIVRGLAKMRTEFFAGLLRALAEAREDSGVADVGMTVGQGASAAQEGGGGDAMAVEEKAAEAAVEEVGEEEKALNARLVELRREIIGLRQAEKALDFKREDALAVEKEAKALRKYAGREEVLDKTAEKAKIDGEPDEAKRRQIVNTSLVLEADRAATANKGIKATMDALERLVSEADELAFAVAI